MKNVRFARRVSVGLESFRLLDKIILVDVLFSISNSEQNFSVI